MTVAGLANAGQCLVEKLKEDALTCPWKTDLHGRFVVDVFYGKGAAGARDILKGGTYLNQELLDKGHAVRMAE